MNYRIAHERSVSALASSLAMMAQRLPFLKNLTPVFGATGGINIAAPLTVTFVGTHSLSGTTVLIVPVNGGTNPTTGKVDEDFVWGFKADGETLMSARVELDGVEGVPTGLGVTAPQSGIVFIGGKPKEAGDYTLKITGYWKSGQSGPATEPYFLNLKIEPAEDPPTPYEKFIATFWSGEDLNDPFLVNATADPDADGIQNLMEFVLDLDPTRPDVMPGTFGAAPNNPQQMRWEIPLNTAANTISVGFEETDDLEAGWRDVPAENVSRTDSVVVLTVPKNDKKYYRLKVVME